VNYNGNGNAAAYIRDERACVLQEWEDEQEQKRQLTLHDQILEFERVDLGTSQRDREHVYWKTTFRAPDCVVMSGNDNAMDAKAAVEAGDAIVVSWEPLNGEDEKVCFLRGLIEKREKQTLVARFSLASGAHPPDYVAPGQRRNRLLIKYTIVFLPRDTIYKRRCLALDYLATGPGDNSITRTILGRLTVADLPPQLVIPDASYSLYQAEFRATTRQTNAVNFALAKDLALIQGPPGCGKTAVIAALCVTLLTDPELAHTRVLVCGTSNVSVENLVRKIRPAANGIGRSLVWLASRSRDEKPSPGQLPEYEVLVYQRMMNRRSKEGKTFQQLERDSWRRPLSPREMGSRNNVRCTLEQQICTEANIICCTLETAGAAALSGLVFPTVILDEATQAVEPSALIPLLHRASKMVLVGDQKQLGPVVRNTRLEHGMYGRSLFERLIELRVPSVMLDCQFRMHPLVSRFPNDTFYAGAIKDGITAADRPSPPLAIFSDVKVPLAFGTLTGIETRRGTSTSNENEANAVQNVIFMLLNGGVDESEIGVISPYKAQVFLLRRMFPSLRFPKLKIASVDSFQGSERDYIVMSTVRSGPEIGFVKNERRLNVSITRARRGLVIVGDSATLAQHSVLWNRLVTYFRGYNAVTTSIPETQLIVRPDPDTEPGFNVQVTASSFSADAARVIWPESPQDLAFLSAWVNRRLAKARGGQTVTIAFDTESVDSGALCIQIGEIFTEDVDQLLAAGTRVDVPAIHTTDALIVFCTQKNGKQMYSTIADRLNRLFSDDQIIVATFDCVLDLVVLETIGVQFRPDRIVDCQLHGLPEGVAYLKYSFVSSLAHRIECIDLNDPILPTAHTLVHGGKHFPWDANAFILKVEKRPPTSIVTKGFLRYSADDIFLTGLAFAEIVREGKVADVFEKTRSKLGEYANAKQRFGTKGPYLVRQAMFRQRDWSVLKGKLFKGAATDMILERWRKLGDLLEVAVFAAGALFTLPVSLEKLKSMLRETETYLMGQERLSDARFLARVVDPPGFVGTRARAP
jgi:hypothetical protein